MMSTKLSGVAASFKGGRRYVHATDLIVWLDAFAADLGDASVVKKVEFHQQLSTIGKLEVAQPLSAEEKKAASVTGILANQSGIRRFAIFPTDNVIADHDRDYAEEKAWDNCKIDPKGEWISLRPVDSLTTAENLSSAMKRLCTQAMPARKRWWFVRLAKDGPLPSTAGTITLKDPRITAGRFVSSKILIDDEEIGRIDFLGHE